MSKEAVSSVAVEQITRFHSRRWSLFKNQWDGPIQRVKPNSTKLGKFSASVKLFLRSIEEKNMPEGLCLNLHYQTNKLLANRRRKVELPVYLAFRKSQGPGVQCSSTVPARRCRSWVQFPTAIPKYQGSERNFWIRSYIESIDICFLCTRVT